MINRDDLSAEFNAVRNDFLTFKKIENRRSNRADLHAMMLLDNLVPGTADIIAGAEHDKVWLEVNLDELCKVLTPELVLELVSCGVLYDAGVESLFMFA